MKLKRLFTAILSAALTLSLCAMPAMAEDGSTTTGAGTTTGPLKTATAIDWKKTGKLTIHKYETLTAPTPTDPTDDGVSTTTGQPLNGVTFTLYQVKDKDWLKEYYQGTYTGTSTPMPTVDDYFETDGSLKPDVASSTKIEVTTGTAGDGTAVADNLKLGLYLVVETKKPDAVKQTTEPFLVSIPMTSSVDTKSWLYDVTVNPKNVTKYGAATLKKVGYTGSTPDGTAMSGYTFKLYKWDSTKWNEITKKPKNGQDNMGDLLGTGGILTTNDLSEISVAGLTQGVYAFVETEVPRTQGYILDAGTAYVFKLDADGAMLNVPDADVTSMQKSFYGTEMTLNNKCVKPTTTSSTNNLEVINYKPDLNKTVKDRKGSTSPDKHTADYAIGDKVTFILTITVPENIAKLSTFKVTDSVTPTQLAYSEDAIVTGTAKGAATETTLRATTDYTINYEPDGSGFTIDFKGTGTSTSLTAIDAYAGKTITITYTAKLLDGAVVVGDAGDTANKNSAELKYSNKTTVTGDTEPEKPYTIHEEAAVYTFKAGIHKTNGNHTNLGGVVFDLYKKFDAATEVMVSTNDGVMYKGTKVPFLADAEATHLGLNDASSDKWYKVAENLTTDAATGIVVANGLPKGTYKFVETKTKDGYNLLSKPVDADLNIEYTTTWRTDTTYDPITGTKKHSVTSTTYNDGEGTYTYNDIEVINRKGFTLPVTGGFGTLLFSGIGLLLVLVGVSVLFSLKKKTNRA